MALTLTDEQEQLRATVEDFARQVVAPVAAHHDAARTFPYEVVAQMGEMGLFGLPFPERWGGAGGDATALFLAIEELARVDSSVAITLEAAVSLGAMPVHRFGTDAQRERYLPDLAAGRALGAFALTEPGGGTDAGALRSRAVLTDGCWHLSGSKAFITNSGTDLTRLITVCCRTGERADGRPELSNLLVEVPAAGLTVEPAYDKVGWHASDTHGLSFDGVEVAEQQLLGQRGRGYADFLSTLESGRIAIAALAVGLAQGCVDECVRYTRERHAFGRPIGRHQAVAHLVAEMETRTLVARAAWYAAAAALAAGRPCRREAAAAKLFASRTAVDNARDATQVFGGYGFMNEYPVARHWRDAKVLEIGEGTNEVQLMLIARDLGVGG